MRANPKFDAAAVITELGVGEALVSFLDEKGRPNVVERSMMFPPASRLGPLSAEERKATITASPFHAIYDQTVDRESAYEKLRGKPAAARPAPGAIPPPPAAAAAPMATTGATMPASRRRSALRRNEGKARRPAGMRRRHFDVSGTARRHDRPAWWAPRRRAEAAGRERRPRHGEHGRPQRGSKSCAGYWGRFWVEVLKEGRLPDSASA